MIYIQHFSTAFDLKLSKCYYFFFIPSFNHFSD